MKTNKKDQRGITHHLMLVGLAVVVLGAIGFAGFRTYKINDTKAKAAGWLTIKTGYVSGKYYAIKACKSSNVAGKVYIINQTDTVINLQNTGGRTVTAGPHSNSAVLPTVIAYGTMSGPIADKYWRVIGTYQATSSQLNYYTC